VALERSGRDVSGVPTGFGRPCCWSGLTLPPPGSHDSDTLSPVAQGGELAQDGSGAISGHFLQEVDGLLGHGIAPKVVWQKLHLKYRVKLDGPTAGELEKFLALPGHDSLRNRAKTLRARANRSISQGDGARDRVGGSDADSSRGSNDMTVPACRGPEEAVMRVQVSDMMEWASAHAWSMYVDERDGSHAPYGRKGPAEHLGLGHELVVLPGG